MHWATASGRRRHFASRNSEHEIVFARHRFRRGRRCPLHGMRQEQRRGSPFARFGSGRCHDTGRAGGDCCSGIPDANGSRWGHPAVPNPRRRRTCGFGSAVPVSPGQRRGPSRPGRHPSVTQRSPRQSSPAATRSRGKLVVAGRALVACGNSVSGDAQGRSQYTRAPRQSSPAATQPRGKRVVAGRALVTCGNRAPRRLSLMGCSLSK